MRTGGGRDDLAAAVCFFVLGIGLLLIVPGLRFTWGEASTARWPEVLALAVGCLGETQRRRHPMLGLVLGAVGLAVGPVLAQAVGIGPFIVFGDLIFCAVRYGSHQASVAVTVGAAALLGLSAVASLVTEGPSAAVMTLLNSSLVLGVPVVWAREVRQHHELAEAERERAEQTRRIAEMDRAAAVAAERARMARDLHDVIAGQLSGIAIQSEAALSVPHADEPALRRVLTTVRRDSLAALGEMRTMIGLLRSDGPPTEPLTAPAGLDRLDELLDSARARGLHVEVADDRPDGAEVPTSVDLAAYRIVQEALTNAAKHAPGSAVRLVLGEQDGQLVVEVGNDLVPGGNHGDGGGTGLIGLAERAAAVGGRVHAGPDGDTWTVRAMLPVGSR